MACSECPNCGWMGNNTKCPKCGYQTVWDEAHTHLGDVEEDTDPEEEEE